MKSAGEEEEEERLRSSTEPESGSASDTAAAAAAGVPNLGNISLPLVPGGIQPGAGGQVVPMPLDVRGECFALF